MISFFPTILISLQIRNTSEPMRLSTISIYTHESRLSSENRSVLKLAETENLESNLDSKTNFVWLSLNKEKKWYLATPLESNHSYSMSKIPGLSLRILGAKGNLKLSDLSDEERDDFCSQIAVADKPFFGKESALGTNVSLRAKVTIQGKDFETTIRSIGSPSSSSSSPATSYSPSEWKRLRDLRKNKLSIEDEMSLNSVFLFSDNLPLFEKFDFLKEASSRLGELIKLRDRKIAENFNRGLRNITTGWAEPLGRNVDFNQLSRFEQDMMADELSRKGAFANKQAAKEWLMANPLLKSGLSISVSVGGIGIGWSYRP